MDHDRLFKELLTTFFVEFLELFVPGMVPYLDRDRIEFLDKEIFTDVTAGERHEVDLLAKCRFRDGEVFFIVHVENQATPQDAFAKRMFRYFARLTEKFDLPVYPIALLSYDAPLRPEPDEYLVEFPDKQVLAFRFTAIQLNRLNWRDYVRQTNPVAAALMAKMKIDAEDRPKVKLECLRLLVTLRLGRARMRLISGFIDSYLKLMATEQQIMQAELTTLQPEQQEPVMEIVTSWMEEGIERGRIEMLVRSLTKRFGPIPPEVVQHVQSLSPDAVLSLYDAISDLTDIDQVRNWPAE